MGVNRVRAMVVAALAFGAFAPSSLSANKHAVGNPAGNRSVHTHHPKDWRFTAPKGDPIRGRAVFEKFECYYCHAVRGESFPEPTESAPELSQMGSLHPIEFFVESVMNPDAVIAKGYSNADGKSPMTRFAEEMTVQELVDVAAYVASLTPKGPPKVVSGRGKIVVVVRERGEIILDHEPLEGFMDAMTMGYRVRSKDLLNGVREGDRVRFTIDTDKRVITRLNRVTK